MARAWLQRELDEAKEQAEAQRRSLSSAFQQQLQEAKAALQGEVADLKQVRAGAASPRSISNRQVLFC